MGVQLDLNVTDTFHIIIKDKKIRSVQTSSNDLTYTIKQRMDKRIA
jgi:hypothetical protein